MRYWKSLSRPWRIVIVMVVLSALAIGGVTAWDSQHSALPVGTSTLTPAGPPADLDTTGFPDTPPRARPAECAPAPLATTQGAWVSSTPAKSSSGDQLAQQSKQLGLLDFFWLNLGSTPTTIVQHPDNPRARSLDAALRVAQAANPCGLRFATIVDAQSPTGAAAADLKSVLAAIVLQPAVRRQHILALATEMAKHPEADGLTLDYEFALPQTADDLKLYARVGQLESLTRDELISHITEGYSQLARELAEAMHHQHRLLRVAALVRTDNELDLTNVAPFMLDYGQLARDTDQVILMAYDFHWSTSDPGPIAPADRVMAVWRYATSYDVPAGRLALAVPNYGYDWIVDATGKILSQTSAVPVSASQVAAAAWPHVGEKDGETRLTYKDGRGQSHEVWDASSGLGQKVSQAKQFCTCPVTVWKIGNDDPVGSAIVTTALH